jgi:hypothetical protein
MLHKYITKKILGPALGLAILIGVALPFADNIYAAAVTKFLGCSAGKGAAIAANNLKGQWVLSAHSNRRADGTRYIRAAQGQCSISSACSRSKGFAAPPAPYAGSSSKPPLAIAPQT